MTAGGRLPPASVALRACTAGSVLPASISLAALSTARCGVGGTGLFLAAGEAAHPRPRLGLVAGDLYPSAALLAANAPVEKAEANPRRQPPALGSASASSSHSDYALPRRRVVDAKHLLQIEPTSTARLEANLLFGLSAYSTVTDLAKLRG